MLPCRCGSWWKPERLGKFWCQQGGNASKSRVWGNMLTGRRIFWLTYWSEVINAGPWVYTPPVQVHLKKRQGRAYSTYLMNGDHRPRELKRWFLETHTVNQVSRRRVQFWLRTIIPVWFLRTFRFGARIKISVWFLRTFRFGESPWCRYFTYLIFWPIKHPGFYWVSRQSLPWFFFMFFVFCLGCIWW